MNISSGKGAPHHRGRAIALGPASIGLVTASGATPVFVPVRHTDQCRANAARFVDCWNACEGLENPEELKMAFQDAHTTLKVLIHLVAELGVVPSSPLGIALEIAIDKSERKFHLLEVALGMAEK